MSMSTTTSKCNNDNKSDSTNFNKFKNYSALYDYLTGTGAHNFTDSVTIGFVGAYGQAPVDLGALPLAIEAVNADKDLLPGRELKFVTADIGSTRSSSLPTRAIRAMTEMRDNGIVAFIGPDASCLPEALVAAAWNLPMISYKCSETKVSNKKIYSTFARTLTPSSKVSKSVVALLKAFKWDKFVLVTGSTASSGSEVKEAIEDLATREGLMVIESKQYSAFYIPRYIEEMCNVVGDTYRITRIYVFVGEHIALIDFIKCLQRRNLLYSGDYVVISVDDEIYDPNRTIKILSRDYLDPFLNESWDKVMGFRSVLKLTPSYPGNPKYKEFVEKIKALSIRKPFCVPYHATIFGSISVSIGAARVFDAVFILARALTEVFQVNGDPRDGIAVIKRILNRRYHSIQGFDVFMDANGDAEGNFTVVVLLDDERANGTQWMSMQPVGYFQYKHNNSSTLPEFKYLNPDRPIQWIGGKVPAAEPECGFFEEKCVNPVDWKIIASIVLISIIVMVAILFGVKHYRYEQKLACLLWKIDMKDVTIIPTETTEVKNRNMIRVCRQSVFHAPTSSSIVEISDQSPKRAYTTIGLYKGNIVAIKNLNKKSVDLTRSIRKELKQIREMRHENLIPFIGASVDHGHVAILTAYSARGSLEDVLKNEDLNLDHMFVSSLVTDILKGMIYIHDSDITSHGNLRSSNCLIDNRWVLQISDFGLHEFKHCNDELDFDNKNLKRMLYRAPELLRQSSPPLRGTQKGDVYSFGIVFYEIIGRNGPWGKTAINSSILEIIGEVKKVDKLIPFRPPLEDLGIPEYILRCMKSCWEEDPEIRPDIRFVRVLLKEMQAGLKPNIFDNMLAIMEKYAYNLEGLVQERTNQLTEEKKKTDALLHRMLPKYVAESLKKGDKVEAEIFDCVTIYFSDIVGFTELSAVSTPLQVIDLLNDLYTCFDSIISHYDVYKVETIGDAYMVVSGLPIRNGDRHAGEIASMALHLLSKIKKFEIKHRVGEVLQLRIGIHSGHCVAGVVGLKMPRYCLFGDTVNTASRMESTGEAFRIHISHATYMLLQRLGGYICEERGLIPIKGKGEMYTYWLIGEDSAQRMARIREEIAGSTLFNSISSERLSKTPDLLRRPGVNLLGSELHFPSPSQSPFAIQHLHNRARLALSLHHSEEIIPQENQLMSQMCLGNSRVFNSNNQRNPSSAPIISFIQKDQIL
ncbi:unnamed protein product [Brassicogethes aeneus]|uniref:guanylate cyclase n=1 Tax=Brassicogethes aeneus TaxID=1431903 RepID=A0A9P0BHT0_BRAAE|nr:unnamed protein product [Brassicogethes aeneus]